MTKKYNDRDPVEEIIHAFRLFDEDNNGVILNKKFSSKMNLNFFYLNDPRPYYYYFLKGKFH